MGKMKVILAIAVLLFVLIIAGTVLLYFFFLNSDNKTVYNEQLKSGMLVNPIIGLDDSKAFEQFNETFVYYLLYSINAYNLHNPPLSSDTPKIKIFVDSEAYSSVVDNGNIHVTKGVINGEDIIIRTSKQEAINMLKDKAHIVSSFSSGASSFEMVAGKVTLALKGYASLYEDLTGKKVI